MSKKKRKKANASNHTVGHGSMRGPSVQELRQFLTEFVFGGCVPDREGQLCGEQQQVLNLPVGASVYSFDENRGVIVRHVIMMNWEGRAHYAISHNGETKYLPAYVGNYFLDPKDAWEANSEAIERERVYCHKMLKRLSAMTVVDENDEVLE